MRASIPAGHGSHDWMKLVVKFSFVSHAGRVQKNLSPAKSCLTLPFHIPTILTSLFLLAFSSTIFPWKGSLSSVLYVSKESVCVRVCVLRKKKAFLREESRKSSFHHHLNRRKALFSQFRSLSRK